MRILIIGATGFIGSRLAERLKEGGHQVMVTSRDPVRAARLLGERYDYINWDGINPERLSTSLEGTDAVVNLAGENLAAGRWTSRRKELLISSRVNTGRALAQAILEAKRPPSVLIQGSATGIYGLKADVPAGESRRLGEGFLAGLTWQWEESVAELRDTNVRLVYIRTGLVLGRETGILPRLNRAFDFGMGVIPGSGNQWLSWIHIEDEVDAIRFLIGNPKASGPFNLTAPNPVTMKKMVQTIGRIRKRPAWACIPSFALKLVLGSMAGETILSSQDILPEALLDAGYAFRFTSVDEALRNILTE